jgi:hypothetical protein
VEVDASWTKICVAFCRHHSKLLRAPLRRAHMTSNLRQSSASYVHDPIRLHLHKDNVTRALKYSTPRLPRLARFRAHAVPGLTLNSPRNIGCIACAYSVHGLVTESLEPNASDLFVIEYSVLRCNVSNKVVWVVLFSIDVASTCQGVFSAVLAP